MIPRVHLANAPAIGGQATLPREQSHHLCRVLRARAGDPLQLFDGAGVRLAAVLEEASPSAARVRVLAIETPGAESPLAITLAQCVSGAEKMDWTVEKAVELGVAAIRPLLSQRSIVRLDDARARRRTEHWRRLAVAACAQCGRDRLPELAEPVPLDAWLASRPAGDPGVVLAPSASLPLSRLDGPLRALDVLVGPESGLTAEEIAAAQAAGLRAVSLGPRTLRTETAGLAALAVLQARFGDL